MRQRLSILLQKLGYMIGKGFAAIGRWQAKRQVIVSPRSILITGASDGIGAELARQYAGPGVFLYLNGRSQQKLNEVAKDCIARGAKVETKALDVCDDVEMDKWIKDLPRLDLVIANAGISGGGMEGLNNDIVREIFSVNIGGVLNTVLPMVEKARAQNIVEGLRGHIAIMGSMAALHALPTAPAYSSSKAAVTAYGDALRGSLRKDKILVSVIGPGYVRTPLTATNNFKMPLLMEVDEAAYLIRRGLWKRHKRIYFPKRIYFLMRFIHSLPFWLTDPIFRNLPKKA